MRKLLRVILLLVVLTGVLLPALGTVAYAQLRVNVMPGNQPGDVYPMTWPGRDMIVWGNVSGGTAPYAYQWDFGDGTAPVSGAVTNMKYIAVNHTYATQGPKLAVLTVTDGAADIDVDTVEIEVAPRTSEVEINAAIESGLRWLYLQQNVSGYWNDNYGYPIAATALSVLSFENQGHLPANDYNKDIYAQYVKAGLDYVTSRLAVVSVPIQTYGNPEEGALGNMDFNGVGIFPSSGNPLYEVGMVMMALVASKAPDMISPTGPANVIGRPYRDLVVDMVDYCAWSQSESGGARGGWRYAPNYGSSDNSVSQWPVIGLEAAKSDWGIHAPDFVKTELRRWLTVSQVFNVASYYDGAFYYSPNSWAYRQTAVTGAGLCQLAYLGISKNNDTCDRTIEFLGRDWVTAGTYNLGNYYAMYAVAKGCRIAVDDMGLPSEITLLGTHNWYNEYAAWLIANQGASGQWPNRQWGYVLDHSWALLILQRTITGGSPVAVIKAPPSAPPSIPIPMDGSFSYHQDPVNHQIVAWQWDFDASDGIDWGNPDATGPIVTNPGYPLPDGVVADTFIATLRVVDDNDPYKAAEVTHRIIVDHNNHPPTAVAGGPYAARIGQPITFDGTGSYDPDAGDHIAAYSWDLDGDGVFGDCTDPVCERTWDAEYRGYISLIVTDSYGAQSWDTSSVRVWTSRVDVSIAADDISFSTPQPQPGNDIQITATVRCDATSTPATGVQVRFFDGDPSDPTNQIGATHTILSMMAGDAVDVTVDFTVPADLPRTIYVKVDPDNLIEEFDETNNLAGKRIESGPTEGIIFGKVTAAGVGLHGVVLNLMVNGDLEGTATTNATGDYEFPQLADGDYVVDLQVPLGMSPVGEAVVPVAVAGEPIEVNFELKNSASGKVWDIWTWKTQLKAIKEGKLLYNGLTLEQVNQYGILLFEHFYGRTDEFAIKILGVTYADGPRALTFDDIYGLFFNDDGSFKAKAERALLTNMLNIVAGRQGQLTPVTVDGATASQTITYFAGLYQAGGALDYYNVYVYLQKMHMKVLIPAGIVPLSTPNIMFKPGDVQLPDRFSLSQNFPNPFNPTTTISFSLPVASAYTLTIYNTAGQVVSEIKGNADAGVTDLRWNGSAHSSGVYLYRLTAGTFVDSKKMMLLK